MATRRLVLTTCTDGTPWRLGVYCTANKLNLDPHVRVHAPHACW